MATADDAATQALHQWGIAIIIHPTQEAIGFTNFDLGSLSFDFARLVENSHFCVVSTRQNLTENMLKVALICTNYRVRGCMVKENVVFLQLFACFGG